jgi:glycerol-3-phosphate O-acyltransferase/dihydroxyacetone phosphate acyltransferase
MAPKPSTAPTASWLYDLILNIFAPSLDIFFREVQVRGAWRVPDHGAVILVVAPHANQVRQASQTRGFWRIERLKVDSLLIR